MSDLLVELCPGSTTSGLTFTGQTEPRGVVGFEVILGAYSPASMAAMSPVSLSG